MSVARKWKLFIVRNYAEEFKEDINQKSDLFCEACFIFLLKPWTIMDKKLHIGLTINSFLDNRFVVSLIIMW